MDTQALAAEFRARLLDGIEQSRAAGYEPAGVVGMLNRVDAVSAAKKLIASGEIQSGMKEMAKLGHKGLTIEAIMSEERFKPLFTKKELDAAAWRLRQV